LDAGAIVMVVCIVALLFFQRKNELALFRGHIAKLVEFDFSPDKQAIPREMKNEIACEIEQLRDALAHKLGMFESMISNILTPMVVVEVDGTIKWINESAIKLVEAEGAAEDHVGKAFSSFFYGDNRETTTEQCIREKKKLFVKTEVKGHKGTMKYISVAASPIFDLQGELIGGFTSIMDFTNIVLKERYITSQNERIAKGVTDASQISEQVAKSSEKIRSEVGHSTSSLHEQQARIGEVAAAMTEMNQTVLEIARNAAGAADVAQHTQDLARSGSGLMHEIISVMEDVDVKAENLRKEMGSLEVNSQGISSIMQVISDIADQTNLLALNAAIEAARAGEGGRGFSVVADEIRKLAEKTLHATKSVEEYIVAIQKSSNSSLQATDETVESIGQASEICNKAGEALSEILACSRDTTAQVESIATASEQQSAASEQINQAVDSVNNIAADTSESMDVAALSVADLTGLAVKLDSYMQDMQADGMQQ